MHVTMFIASIAFMAVAFLIAPSLVSSTFKDPLAAFFPIFPFLTGLAMFILSFKNSE